MRSAESVNEIVYQQKGVTILNSDLIQCAVVLYEAESAVFLFNTEDWSSDRGF